MMHIFDHIIMTDSECQTADINQGNEGAYNIHTEARSMNEDNAYMIM